MPPIPELMRAPTPRLALVSTLTLALLAGGCSDDADDSQGRGLPASTAYVGVVAADNGQTGPLNLSFASPVAAPPGLDEAGAGPSLASSAPVNVSGTMQLGGAPLANIQGVLENGSFEAQTDQGYALSGTLEQGVLTGDIAGPGALTGHLVAASSSGASPVRTFCGTFDGEDTDAASTTVEGTFSLAVAGGRTAGALYFWTADSPGVFEYDTLSVFFEGAATMSSISVAQTDSATGHLLTVTGTYDATTVSGSLLEAEGEVPYLFGDFSGTSCE